MDFSQIQELIRMVSKHKLSEFSLKEGDFKLTIRNQGSADGASVPVLVQATPQPVFAPPPPVAIAPVAATPVKTDAVPAAGGDANEARYIAIKSPMVGTFYRSNGPDKGPYVKIGDSVDSGQTVCIIEAMKLFNEIESDIKGKIMKVLVEDSTPVEYDQPLFLVDPS